MFSDIVHLGQIRETIKKLLKDGTIKPPQPRISNMEI